MLRSAILTACLLVMAAPILADECPPCALGEGETNGGDQRGVLIREKFTIEQDKFDSPGATDLHFKAWQKEDDRYLNGWKVCVQYFNSVDAVRGDQPEPWHSIVDIGGEADNGRHAIDVDATNPVAPGFIAHGTEVSVTICFWLSKWNTKRMADIEWTDGPTAQKACPSFGWTVGYPYHIDGNIYGHDITIANDDSLSSIHFAQMDFRFDSAFYPDLGGISFAGADTSISDYTLGLNDSLVITIQTNGKSFGSHIYGNLVLDGMDYQATDIFDHVITNSIPTPTLTEWGLVILLMLLIATAVVVIRKRTAAPNH